jgi:spore coat protein CotH
MFKIKYCTYFLITIFNLPLLFGSIPYYGESQNLFDDESIAEIHLSINADSLEWLFALENVGNSRYLSASFSFQNGRIHQRMIVPNVGFRLRGAIPRYSKKKDFKISFNAYEPGRSFLGIKKLNLRGLNRDPGVIREKLVLDLLREIDAPASRASYARFYINDEYYGLYLMLEEVDRVFLNAHFGNSDGNLYKCARVSLEYCQDGNYKYTYGPLGWAPCDEGRVYELQTNEAEDDYSDLAHFIQVLNKTSDAEFKEEIEKVFNVRDFLKGLAVNTLVGDCDGYWRIGNNYFLYHNTWTGRFEFIFRDLDLTLGVCWATEDLSTNDIYNFGPRNNGRPLVHRILNVSEFNGLYSRFVREIIDGPFHPDSLWPRVIEIKSMIQSAVEEDPYRPLDYGWSMDDFNRSYLEGIGTFHVIDYPIPFDFITALIIGLKPFIEARTASAYEQLDLSHAPPAILGTDHIPMQPTVQDSVAIISTVTNFGKVDGVSLYVDLGSGFERYPMLDDGKHGDKGAGDSIYGFRIPPLSDGQIVRYYIGAYGNSESDCTNDPYDAPNSTYLFKVGEGFPSLVINEFLADNVQTIGDERGSYDDWLELYNPGNEKVRLSGMYLTNDLGNPTLWQFPDTTIAPDGFILVWADGDGGEGPLHASFNLNKGGGQIGLFLRKGMEVIPIDQFIFDPQMTDISYGRFPDAKGDWRSFSKATPGRSNMEGEVWTGLKDEIIGPIRDYKLFQNFPNPFNSTTTIQYEISERGFVRLAIYNIGGQEVKVLVNEQQAPGNHKIQWDGRDETGQFLSTGVYIYRLSVGAFHASGKLVLIR